MPTSGCWPRWPPRTPARRWTPRRCAATRWRCCGCWSIPALFRAVLGGGPPRLGGARPRPSWCSRCSVQRAAAELASMGHVPERTGPRQRVPLFDAPALRDFLAAPARRLFLAELLASFTRVASGRYRVRGCGGRTRTRRFSELDPVRLAGPAGRRARRRAARRVPQARRRDAVPDRGVPRLRHRPRPRPGQRRPAAARRPAARRRSRTPGQRARPSSCSEHLGARWYRAARDLAPVRHRAAHVVGEVADRFRQARRVLNHVADQYLFPSGNPWFAQPGS